MQCPSCRLSVRDTDNFCSHCGATLRSRAVSRPTCRVCSSALPERAQFCGNCGARDPLQPVASAVSPPPVPSREAGAKLKLPSTLPPLPGSRLAARTPTEDGPVPRSAAEPPAPPHGPKRPIGLAKPLHRERGGGALERSATAEMTPRFDPPGGWPALREALEELDYYRGQGLEDEARRTLSALRKRHPGHPELAAWMHRHARPARSERPAARGQGTAADDAADGQATGALEAEPAAWMHAEAHTAAGARAGAGTGAEADAAAGMRAAEGNAAGERAAANLAGVRAGADASAETRGSDASPPAVEAVGAAQAGPGRPGRRAAAPAAPGSTESADPSASALRLTDLDDQEIDAALEEFGPEDSLRAPIADFEERSPNITGHTVIARNPLLMAPPSEGQPGRALVLNPASPPNPDSRLSAGPRPLARTIVTSTLLPPRSENGTESPRSIAASGLPMGTAVYGASGNGLLPFPPEPLDIPLEVELDDSDEIEELTEDGVVLDQEVTTRDRTLVTPHLNASASYVAQPILPVHVQVIGARGRVLAAFTIPPGIPFDVGRTEGRPWYDDAHLLPQHAQLLPAPGGGVALQNLPQGGAVYRQLESAERLSHGDQIRVGQSTLLYEQAIDGHGRLHVQRNSRGPVDIVTIPRGGLSLGRDHGDIVFSSDTYVSSEHCRVIPTPDGVYVEDLGSSNGTYLRVRTTEQIPFGTLLLMGQTQFRITAG